MPGAVLDGPSVAVKQNPGFSIPAGKARPVLALDTQSTGGVCPEDKREYLALISQGGNMAKILLVKPFQPAVCTGMSPPLGILYLASTLREQLGERVSVTALDARLYSLRPDEIAHAARDADIVGISAENLEAAATKEIARLVKRLDPA